MSLLSSRSSRTHWNPSRNLPQSRVETTIGAALECGNSQHADPKFTMVNISDIWRSNPTTLSQLRIDRIRSITSNPICHPLPSQSDGESPFHHPWLLAVRCWEFAWKIDQDYSHRLHPGVASELRSCSSSELPPGLCDSARTPEMMNLAQLGAGQSIVLEIWRFNWQKVCQHFDLMCLSPFFFWRTILKPPTPQRFHRRLALFTASTDTGLAPRLRSNLRCGGGRAIWGSMRHPILCWVNHQVFLGFQAMVDHFGGLTLIYPD